MKPPDLLSHQAHFVLIPTNHLEQVFTGDSLSLEQFVFQPFANGFVIELERCPCYGYGDAEEADGNHDMLVEWGILMIECPSHLYIDERIVRDVERVGDVTKELAELLRLLANHFTAGAHSYDERENSENDNRLIQSVHPEIGRIRTSHSRYRLTDDDNKGTPPESSLY